MLGRGMGDMFSCVPAAGYGRPFARPVIELSRFVNPASWQSARATAVTATEARTVWDDVVRQVRSQHLDLAVFLAEPEILPGHAVLARSDHAGCAAESGDGDEQSCSPATRRGKR